MANNSFITVADLNRLNRLEEKLQLETNNRLNALEMKVNNLRVLETYLEEKVIALARQEDLIQARIKELEAVAAVLEKDEEIWQPSLTDLYCDEIPGFYDGFDIGQIEDLL